MQYFESMSILVENSCCFMMASFPDALSSNARETVLAIKWRFGKLTLLLVLFLQSLQFGSGDYYTGYTEKVVRIRKGNACEGDYLMIQCPVMTTITIQGTMCGRKVPSRDMCPIRYTSLHHPAAQLEKEDTNCEAVTSFVKIATECENRRVCQLLVYPRVFGSDPCPNTTKYLTVTYKCRLLSDELRTSEACQSSLMRLRCSRRRTVIAVYNVTVEDNEACLNKSNTNCTMTTFEALDYVTKFCHKQHKCAIPMSSACGSFVRARYACVPRQILTNQIPNHALSTVSSPDRSDNIIEASSIATSSPNESAPDIPIVPRIISIHPTEENNEQNPLSTTDSTQKRPEGARMINLHVAKNSSTSRYSTVSIALNRKSSVNWEDVKKIVEATNEFALSDDDDATQSEPTAVFPFYIPRNSPNIINTTVSSHIIFGNTTLSPGFAFWNSLMKLFSYFKENLDKVLVVAFASVCVALFLTVIMLLFQKDRRKARENEKKVSAAESASLLGDSDHSPGGSSSTAAGNFFNTARHPDDNHTTYINGFQKRHKKGKKCSRTQLLLKKWCSCCCSNAPCQRNNSDSDDSCRMAPQTTSVTDDDIISAIVVNGRDGAGEPLPLFPTTAEVEVGSSGQDNALSQGTTSNDQPRFAYDNISEYEFQDNEPTKTHAEPNPIRPSTLQTTFRAPATMYQNHRSVASSSPSSSASHQYTQLQPATYIPPRIPPPFPKPVSFGYEPQTLPHYATHRVSHQQLKQSAAYQQPGTRSYVAYNSTQPRHQQAYIPIYSSHGVALRPHQDFPNSSTLNLNQSNQRFEQRGSFYDNSIPSDSPIYEYYQRQENRKELPGTRNINQYFS